MSSNLDSSPMPASIISQRMDSTNLFANNKLLPWELKFCLEMWGISKGTLDNISLKDNSVHTYEDWNEI